MNGHKPVLRLLIVTQTFVLFAIIVLPTLVHLLRVPLGKIVYGILASICILLALLLHRALSGLE